jgi:beta-lactamase class A
MAVDGNRRRPGRAPVATALGGTVVVAVVLGVLYLPFRGAPGGPVAEPLAAGTSGPRGPGSGALPARLPGARAAASRAPALAGAADHASPFGAALGSYLARRSGTVRLAVYDVGADREWSLGGGAAQAAASVVKVDILETLLSQRPAGLSAGDAALARQMIEDSDNDAATSLWDEVGGGSGIGAYDMRAGLARTAPSPCVRCAGFRWPGWGLTTTTPEDQVTLMRRLLAGPGGALTAAQRRYALSLLEGVTTGQRWGVSGGVPAGVTVAVKDGWLPLDAASSDWQVNSVGWVSGGGRDYVLAMLSTANPSEQYGIDTLNSLGSMVWSALAPGPGKAG